MLEFSRTSTHKQIRNSCAINEKRNQKNLAWVATFVCVAWSRKIIQEAAIFLLHIIQHLLKVINWELQTVGSCETTCSLLQSVSLFYITALSGAEKINFNPVWTKESQKTQVTPWSIFPQETWAQKLGGVWVSDASVVLLRFVEFANLTCPNIHLTLEKSLGKS